MTLLTGCDVSVFQPPGLVDWSRQDFGIVRATYGTKHDKSAVEHVKRIRGAGKVAGLYHFYRADQDGLAQMDAFRDVAEKAGLGVGDLLPCIDVEDYPGHTISPSDLVSLTYFEAQIRGHYGDAIMYTTQRDWHRLGCPAWYLERPLWVAHYPRYGSTSPLSKPATPSGAPWRIWQCMVGPLGQQIQKHDHPQAVDQNLASSPLPLIEQPKARKVEFGAIPFALLTEDDWAEMTAARDRRIREDSV